MLDQPACPPLARSSSTSPPGRSKTSKPAAPAALSARSSTDELMHGLQAPRQAWTRPVSASRSAALRRRAGRLATAARRRPTSRRRPRRIIRPDSVANTEDSEARQRGRGERRAQEARELRGRHWGFRGPTARPRREEAQQRGRHRGFRGPTAWPRREEARQRGQLQGPRVAWPTSRPADSARGRLQGPPAAWPTCNPFRRWPGVSTRGKAPAAVPKSRRRGQDELCLPPLHGTRGGAVERATPGARRGKSGVCASSRPISASR